MRGGAARGAGAAGFARRAGAWRCHPARRCRVGARSCSAIAAVARLAARELFYFRRKVAMNANLSPSYLFSGHELLSTANRTKEARGKRGNRTKGAPDPTRPTRSEKARLLEISVAEGGREGVG